jgi:2-polyprenyl-3-methyl-5-hydroxy-6-metoxy-1,4-benzoquinol methylase
VDSPDYFANHRRAGRFPWSLYHRALTRPIARAIAAHGSSARVLVVGCGLEPVIPGAPTTVDIFACDIDPRAIEACKRAHPDRAHRFAVCPDAYALPEEHDFAGLFDVVVAKEVIEHTLDPSRWARMLAHRLVVGGTLILTTPNYGRMSTLPLLESTILEWLARRDGFSRKHIHPSKFDKRRFARLDVGDDMRLLSVETTLTGWSLIGMWRRLPT